MKVHLHKRLSRLIRGRLRSRVLATHGIGVVAATRNGTLVVDPGDFNVSRRLLTRGEYDWPEVRLLCGLIRGDSRVVFVGAHVGALLVPLVLATGTRDVVAFEPSPKNHRMLQLNLRLNDIPNVTVHNAAVGQRSGACGSRRTGSTPGTAVYRVRMARSKCPSRLSILRCPRAGMRSISS